MTKRIMATPAPESQEKEIDIYNTKINGTIMYKIINEKINDLKVSYNIRKIEMTKEQKIAEMSLYNFINYIFTGKYKKYEQVEFIAPTPQQSIFDAEGWCSDFNKAPQDYDTPILVKYYCGWGKCKRVTVGHYEDAIADYSHESGFYTYYETGCIRETKKINDLISWKLLPTGASE